MEEARIIVAAFSKKSGYDFTELFSEAISKLPIIANNYIPELGNKYIPYMKSSLRGYLKNYIRDYSFKVRIPRKVSEIYMKTRNYSSYLIASAHTKWSEEEIREAHEKMRLFRGYNVGELQSWNTENNSNAFENAFALSPQIIEESKANKDLLFDYYINEVNEKTLSKRYGKDWKNIIENNVEKIKQICIDQGVVYESA